MLHVSPNQLAIRLKSHRSTVTGNKAVVHIQLELDNAADQLSWLLGDLERLKADQAKLLAERKKAARAKPKAKAPKQIAKAETLALPAPEEKT